MIPLFKVHNPPKIGEKLQEVWDSGFVTEGEWSDEFERQFGEYIGNPYVSLVNSCTSALHLSARLCDIQPGDEVITTAMTCMATNEPFFNEGAKIVFADINPTTGNIDPNSIREKITDKTKAIVVVHWAGQPCDMNEICKIGKEHGIKVVEDAAHALRAKYDGKLIGNHGDYVCFSFQGIKHLTTGDGGAITCKSKEEQERIRKLRWFGLDRHFTAPAGQPPASRWEQDITESGYKYHMNNINARIGIEQMKYIDDVIDRHIDNALYYDEHISNPKVEILKRDPKAEPSFWIYSILVDGDRQRFKDYLEENGIASDVVHVRNDQYSCFKDFKDDTLEGLRSFESRLLHIPVGFWVTDEDREHIVKVVNSYE
jgi:dTDP-4-amino-4,6-dideoxygalactose transaminase|tara:strand:- start:495 stop:1607 length:1113 start_codon:yes stop_codon:yes gene_type:complete